MTDNHFVHKKRSNVLTRVFLEDEALINKKLPKELLLRIFSYLDVTSLCRCAQVSKAWNILALDGSNWSRIDLFNFQTDVEGPVLENISRRCGGFLRQISLRGCQSMTDNSLNILAQYCNNVEDINLNLCKKLTDATSLALSKHCAKLQRLDLASCSFITDQSLKALADGCRNLTHINISWCINITENGVIALARGCQKLESFTSKGCVQLTSEAYHAS
ncbi:F-box/LRR-repeat protein 20-like [Diaphorina citri]|uniref:F-box/LRR-repeat protein 20-like n=1 Tax=Diaphorina citri TaxID=121845 RepID=A0A3Q0JAQ0_DIACI|nr:F-box/LRR-repeat protein 20-like [Diaphorina citri]